MDDARPYTKEDVRAGRDIGRGWGDARVLATVEALEAVARERDTYRDALLARHGGEPLALLAELDAARAEVERLRAALEAVRGALIATDQEPDGMPDPRRPLATMVWAALGETGGGK